MLVPEMVYTVRQLARLAGVSVRTLQYYDRIGLLRPTRRDGNGYRQYADEAIVPLQQILFFRELGFSLSDIKGIMSSPKFDVLEALESHRTLLQQRAERVSELLATVDRTIRQLKEGDGMQIGDYYQGFSEETIEGYRDEVRKRWGEDTLRDSEARVLKMGTSRFAELQSEGDAIFRSIADNMVLGIESALVQQQVARWRGWIEHFSRYSDEAACGLGQMYGEDPRFAAYFSRYHPDLPGFFARAVAHYFAAKKG